MSKDNKTGLGELRILRTPILLSTTIVISALCLLLFTWFRSVSTNQTQSFTDQYNQGIADTSAAYLGQLIEDENAEAIDEVVAQLSMQNSILKVSVYRRNGELLSTQGQTDQPHSSPVIANINFEDSSNGYLVIYLSPADKHKAGDQPIWFNEYTIWVLGALIWSLVVLLLYGKDWLNRKPKVNGNSSSSKVKPNGSNLHLLKSLIKKNRKHEKSFSPEHSILIKADWTKLSYDKTQSLLTILGRWLPQNEVFASQLSKGMLILGVENTDTPIRRSALYALQQCLQDLQLGPKIIVHRLNFGIEIYQHFFNVIQPSIWIEKSISGDNQQYQWPIEKTIDIDIGDKKVIELAQLKDPDAEQRSAIERQVRFLSED